MLVLSSYEPRGLAGDADLAHDSQANFAHELGTLHDQSGGANLMLVILPTDNAKNAIYTEIKRITDTVIGVASQKWIRGMDAGARSGGPGPMRGGGGYRGGRGGGRGGGPAKRTDRSLFTQVVLKVNAKLGEFCSLRSLWVFSPRI